ncbi:hypothetical protein MTO96_017960 [Rhipicephalus appendiculatus]
MGPEGGAGVGGWGLELDQGDGPVRLNRSLHGFCKRQKQQHKPTPPCVEQRTEELVFLPELNVASMVTLGAPAVLPEQVASEEQCPSEAQHMVLPKQAPGKPSPSKSYLLLSCWSRRTNFTGKFRNLQHATLTSRTEKGT